MSVVENKVAKIPAIPKSNVIINCIPLSGIQGDATFNTSGTRSLVLAISADTPLPIDKYIGSTLLVAPNGESEPHIQATMIPAFIAVGTDSLDSKTLVYSLSTQFKVGAASITETNPDGTEITSLNTASISINIITDGVVVSLDKAKSQLIPQS